MPPVEEVMEFWIRNNVCDTVPAITELPNTNLYDGSTVTLFNYHAANPLSEIRFYRINGGGHSVAGYEPGSNKDIKAFEVIWDFFKTKYR
jgi:poly(3-hydroxybutyrate) depolymerase